MRKASRRRSNGYLMVMMVLCVLLCCLFFHTVGAQEQSKQLYYTSVNVRSGDSLWSIAETYAAKADGVSTGEYVKKLKKLNNIKSDTLPVGSYLTVYYLK